MSGKIAKEGRGKGGKGRREEKEDREEREKKEKERRKEGEQATKRVATKKQTLTLVQACSV